MATLNVIYKIAADISGLQSGVERAAQATEKMRDGLASLQRSVIEAFSGDAVVEFAKGMLEAGHNIEKMAAQTGIGVDQVQKLQYIAGQSGSAVESLVGAMQNLEQRIGSENSGAAGAMAKLGIEMDSFNKLNGYEQMALLGDAITSIKDPTEQASDAAALFGKTWKEILPALKSGFKETGEQAAIMSDETVKALADGEKRMLAFKQTLTSWAGTALGAFEKVGNAVGQFLSTFNPEHFGVTTNQVLKFAAAVNDPTGLYGALSKVEPKALEVGAALGSVALSASEAAGITIDLVRQGNESIKMHEAAAKAAEAHAKELDKAAASAQKFRDSVKSFSFGTFIEDTSKLNAIIPDMSAHVEEMAAKFSEARDQLDDLTSTDISYNSAVLETDAGVRKMFTAFSTLPNVIAQNTKLIKEAGDTIETSLGSKASDALGGMIKILHSARTAFTDFAATAATGAKTMIDSWKNTHSVFDLVVNAATTAISLIAKLFTDTEKQVNPVRQAFVDLNGGLAALNEKAFAAGMTLTAMLNAKTPEAYTAAINALNDAFKFQDDAMKTLDDTTKKYGFSIEQLGPAFAAQKLHEQAGQLLQDYQVLTAAGVDHVAIIEKMTPAMQDYVNQSILTGTAIPEAMRPVLQSFIDAGAFVDAAGEKMTDLSGLTFTETLDKKFSTLIDTINKLTDAISRGLGTAIQNIPQPSPIHVPIVYDYPPVDTGGNPNDNFAATGGLVTAMGIQHFAAGGNVRPFRPRGSDTVPAMLTPGEMVLTRGQQAAVFGHGGGGVVIQNSFTVAVNVDTPANREALRKVVDDATMQALRRQKRTNVA